MMKDILLGFIPTQWLRKSEVWVCVCKVRHFSSAAECWNPVTWAFKRFWGQSRNKYINSRANSCPLSLRFLFLRSLVWVFAGQSLIWFWRQIKLMSYPGFYLSCKKQPIGGVAPLGESRRYPCAMWPNPGSYLFRAGQGSFAGHGKPPCEEADN